MDKGEELGLGGWESNARDINLVKGILCCGLAPNICRLVKPTKEVPYLVDKEGIKSHPHPSSVCWKTYGSGTLGMWCIYHRKVNTTKLYVHDLSFVSAFSLMLFGGVLTTCREMGRSKRTVVEVDGWIRFSLAEDGMVLLKFLKKEMEKMLLLKIEDPATNLIARRQPIVGTIRKILRLE